MRIVAFSDSHGQFDPLYQIVCIQKAHTDLFLHLGDGAREVEDLQFAFPGLPILAVRGNCDYGSTLPLSRTLSLNHHTLFITHGHGYGVKSSCDPLVKAALAQGADVALFGHTHEALSTQRDGIFLVNPGSVSRARQGGESYAVIDLLEHTLVVSIAPYPPGSLRKPY